MLKVYGYGIVDRNRKPWMSETCVSTTPDEMDEIASALNDRHFVQEDDRRPYRVIRLLFESKQKKG